MTLPALTGAQRTKLRSLGQTMPDTLLIGRDGASPAAVAQLDVGSSRVDLQACKLEYSIVSPK